MNKLKLLLSCVLVGIVVALVYYLFENAVHHSITYLWDTVFDSESVRYLVIPLAIGMALIFYGFQHRLDPGSENKEGKGLGGEPISPTLKNIGVILFLGYFSLLAGASLGPEAVLVPACVVIGSYIGIRLFKKDKQAQKALAAAAIMALMTAFFHSFIIGILSIFLVKKQTKVEISPVLIVIAIIASASSYFTLHAIDPTNHYFNFPSFSWKIALIDLFVGIILVAAGFISTFALKYAHILFVQIRSKAKVTQWWQLALFAGLGLSCLYLIGGPLVEFTGNESINPLIQQATSLGALGLLGIFVVKILAIGWSKAMGYRGGLIFPMIFIASTLVALAQLAFKDANFGVCIIAALIGILAADKKAKILL